MMISIFLATTTVQLNWLNEFKVDKPEAAAATVKLALFHYIFIHNSRAYEVCNILGYKIKGMQELQVGLGDYLL